MSYTLGEAAVATGMSKMTIQRAIKKGRISAQKNDDGSYSIEPVELHRVYPRVTQSDDKIRNKLQSDTPSDTNMLRRELEVKDEKIHALQSERDRERRTLETTIDDLRQDRDHWRQQAEHTTRLLTDERTKKPKSSSRYWLFGIALLLLIGAGLLGYWYWLPG